MVPYIHGNSKALAGYKNGEPEIGYRLDIPRCPRLDKNRIIQINKLVSDLQQKDIAIWDADDGLYNFSLSSLKDGAEIDLTNTATIMAGLPTFNTFSFADIPEHDGITPPNNYEGDTSQILEASCLSIDENQFQTCYDFGRVLKIDKSTYEKPCTNPQRWNGVLQNEPCPTTTATAKCEKFTLELRKMDVYWYASRDHLSLALCVDGSDRRIFVWNNSDYTSPWELIEKGYGVSGFIDASSEFAMLDNTNSPMVCTGIGVGSQSCNSYGSESYVKIVGGRQSGSLIALASDGNAYFIYNNSREFISGNVQDISHGYNDYMLLLNDGSVRTAEICQCQSRSICCNIPAYMASRYIYLEMVSQ